MFDFGKPFCFDVVKRRRADNREADEENVGLWIRKGAQSVIVFLTGCVPKTKADRFAIDHNTGGVVVEPNG